jgi:hypothetical protein
MTTLAVIAGMVFSLAIALLVEELIFGKVLCRFFVQQTAQNQAKALASGVRPPAAQGELYVACQIDRSPREAR